MQWRLLGEPCRNFQFFDAITLVDPKDGQEKAVLANFVCGGTGNVIFVDPETGEGESVQMPGDQGGEGLLNLDNEKLLVGTSQTYGYLHCLDLRTRKWAKPLRDPNETYIWNLCRGSDGMVYGGTYPGCRLLRYDPARHILTNLGRVSENKDDLYSRWVYSVPGHILVSCICAAPQLVLWNIESGKVRPFGKPGARVKEITERLICTVTDGQLDFYDARTFERLEGDHSGALTPVWKGSHAGTGPALKLRTGARFCLRGQEYYIARADGTASPLRPIPAPPPPTSILTIASDANGRIWGSSGLGQTIFSLDPSTGKAWNSMTVCNNGGEVYGMAFAGGRLLMSAYSGGDHIVYDPDQPWDQLGNTNPRTLESVGAKMIRPEASSVIGPDGNFWTGWQAKYGVYGGGLSCVDVKTLQVRSWYDPIPGQAITGLAADKRYLYFTTSGSANGLPEKKEPLHFAVWSPDGKIVWKHQFGADVWLCSFGLGVAAVNGRVLLKMFKGVRIFNPERMEFESFVDFDETPASLMDLGDGTAGVFCGAALWRVSPLTGAKEKLSDLPEPAGSGIVTPSGMLVAACGSRLYASQV